MVSRLGNVTVNKQQLYTAERKVLDLLKREDINMLEFTAIDEARQTIDFIAADLPAYGLKTFWIYPHGLQDEGQRLPLTHLPAGQEQDQASTHPSIENEFYTVEANQEDATLTVTYMPPRSPFTGLNRPRHPSYFAYLS